MKLEINSTVIPSPLTPELFLCKELTITGEDGKVLYVSLLKDKDDLATLTNTQPHERNEWLATIYESKGGEQLTAFYIGNIMVNRDDRYCADTRALEGISESDAVRKVIGMTFDKLISPMVEPVYANIVRSDLMPHAHWMLRSGMLHLTDGSEYKVYRESWNNIAMQRIYRVTNQNLAVKQTLLTTQMSDGIRQTMLYKGADHTFATFDDLVALANGYNVPYPKPGFGAVPVASYYEDIEIKHPYILQQVTGFVQSGYSKDFIMLFINESNAMLEKHQPRGGFNTPLSTQGSMQQQYNGVPQGSLNLNHNGLMSMGVAQEIMQAFTSNLNNNTTFDKFK